MYRTEIHLKKDISPEQLEWATEQIISHFDNRAGKIENTGISPYYFIFEGDSEKAYSIIGLGILRLYRVTGFNALVESWPYEDTEEPEESYDILEVLDRRRSRRKYGKSNIY